MTAEEIAEQYPHLTLAQVYAALAYYHANQPEIVAELESEAEEAAKLEALFEESDSPETCLEEIERLWERSTGDSKGRRWKREDLYDRPVLR